MMATDHDSDGHLRRVDNDDHKIDSYGHIKEGHSQG